MDKYIIYLESWYFSPYSTLRKLILKNANVFFILTIISFLEIKLTFALCVSHLKKETKMCGIINLLFCNVYDLQWQFLFSRNYKISDVRTTRSMVFFRKVLKSYMNDTTLIILDSKKWVVCDLLNQWEVKMVTLCWVILIHCTDALN